MWRRDARHSQTTAFPRRVIRLAVLDGRVGHAEHGIIREAGVLKNVQVCGWVKSGNDLGGGRLFHILGLG